MIAKNYISSVLSKVFIGLIGFLIIPVIVSKVGAESYALLAVFILYTSIASSYDLGFCISITQNVSGLKAVKGSVNRFLVGNRFEAAINISFVALLSGCFTAYLHLVFNVDDSFLLLVFFVISIAKYFIRVNCALLAALNVVYVANRVNNCLIVVKVIGSLLILWLGGGISIIIPFYLLSNLCFFLFLKRFFWIKLNRSLIFLAFKPSTFKRLIKEKRSLSAEKMYYGVLSQSSFYSDKVFASIFLPPSLFAIYSIFSDLAQKSSELMAMLSSVIFPKMASVSILGGDLRKIFVNVLILMLSLGAMGFFIALLIYPSVLDLLFDLPEAGDYRNGVILISAVVLLNLFNVLVNFFHLKKRLRPVVRAYVLSLIWVFGVAALYFYFEVSELSAVLLMPACNALLLFSLLAFNEEVKVFLSSRVLVPVILLVSCFFSIVVLGFPSKDWSIAIVLALMFPLVVFTKRVLR